MFTTTSVMKIIIKAIDENTAATIKETENRIGRLRKTLAKASTDYNSGRITSDQFKHATNKLNEAMLPLKEQLDNMKIGTEVVGKEITKTESSLGKSVKTVTKYSKVGNKLRQTHESITEGMVPFKMELLGIMFFGMAIQRLFMSMLTPALELSGVFDIWGTILQILFLPIALALLPLFLWILDLVLNMSDSVKFFIGIIAVVGVIIGVVLMVIGMLGLGLGALFIAFAIVEVPILLIIGALLAFIAVIILIITAVENNFLHIKELFDGLYQAIENIISGITNVIQGFFDMFIGIVTLDGKKIREGFDKFIKGIKEIFIGGFKKIRDTISKWLSDIFSDFFAWFEDVVKGFREWVERVVSIIWKLGSRIGNAFLKGLEGFGFGFVADAIRVILGIEKEDEGGKTVDDAIITPQGVVYTAPSDYLIATKTPGSIGGGMVIDYHPTIHMNNDISSDVDISRIKKELSEDLAREIDGRLRR